MGKKKKKKHLSFKTYLVIYKPNISKTKNIYLARKHDYTTEKSNTMNWRNWLKPQQERTVLNNTEYREKVISCE